MDGYTQKQMLIVEIVTFMSQVRVNETVVMKQIGDSICSCINHPSIYRRYSCSKRACIEYSIFPVYKITIFEITDTVSFTIGYRGTDRNICTWLSTPWLIFRY